MNLIVNILAVIGGAFVALVMIALWRGWDNKDDFPEGSDDV